jgi:hypothetical protein
LVAVTTISVTLFPGRSIAGRRFGRDIGSRCSFGRESRHGVQRKRARPGQQAGTNSVLQHRISLTGEA